MDARGYGRRASAARSTRMLTATCTLGGLVGVLCGTYGLLDAGTPGWAGVPLLIAGLVVALVGMTLAGRRATRTRYRPDPWRAPEWVTALSGAIPAAVLVVAGSGGSTALLGPSVPLAWPSLPLLPALAILVALAPAVATPPQEERANDVGVDVDATVVPAPARLDTEVAA